MISAKNLSIGYGDCIVVSNADFRLNSGSSLALIGANGSGKSTLLKTIASLLPPMGGEIKVGESIDKIAYVGQASGINLDIPISVYEFALTSQYASLGIFGKISKENTATVMRALEFMQIDNLQNFPLVKLSGGQKQRLMLACVLAKCPTLVLMDEPTNNLDANGKKLYFKMLELLIKQGATIITATHDLKEAALYDYVGILSGGSEIEILPSSDGLQPQKLLGALGILQ